MGIYRKIAFSFLASKKEKQKVSPKIQKKIFKKLAPNRYQDKDKGTEIGFSTAYSRQHAKAVEDYNKEVGDFFKQKEENIKKQKEKRSPEEMAKDIKKKEESREQQRNKDEKTKEQQYDEGKATKDQFRADIHEDPKRFMENLIGGKREKAIHIQYAHEIAKSLADTYDERAMGLGLPPLEEVLGLDSSKFTPTKREEEQNEAEAKENKRKYKEGEITKNDFTRLEQRRNAKKQLRKKQRKKEIIRAIGEIKGMDFPNVSNEEAMEKMGISEKELNSMPTPERNKKKKEIEKVRKAIKKEKYPEFASSRTPNVSNEEAMERMGIFEEELEEMSPQEKSETEEKIKEVKKTIKEEKKKKEEKKIEDRKKKVIEDAFKEVTNEDAMKRAGISEDAMKSGGISEEAMKRVGISEEELNSMPPQEKEKKRKEIEKAKKEIKKEKRKEIVKAKKELQEERKELLEKNPVLKLMSAFRKTTTKEEAVREKTTLNEHQEKRLRRDFLNTITEKLGDSSVFGSERSTSGSEIDPIQAISKAISSMDIKQLQNENMEDVAEGFSVAIVKLQSALEGKGEEEGGLLENLDKLHEEIQEIKGGEEIGEKKGVELGAMVAASAMEKTYTNNPLFGVDSSPSTVFSTFKNFRNETVTVENEEHLLKTSRFSARKNNKRGVDSTRNNHEEINSKMAEMEKRNQKGSAEYVSLKAAKDGLEVSLILQGADPLPDGVKKPPSYLIELAKQTDLDSAYDALSSHKNIENSDASNHIIQTNLLKGLNDDHLSQALGGDSGPFADVLELIKDEVCPDIPLNGEMAGEKIGPGDVCPYPINPGIKRTLRNHAVQMMVDHHIVNPTAPLSSSSSFNYNIKKKKETPSSKTQKKMKQVFDLSPDKFQEILTKGTDEEREESLSWLIYQMRVKQLEEMDFGNYDSKRNKTKDETSRDVAKRNAILEMIKKNKEGEVKDLLSKLNDAMKADLSSDMRGKSASINKITHNFYSSFIQRRYLSRKDKIMPIKKTSTVQKEIASMVNSFKLGMRAYPFFIGNPTRSGVVVGIFPAIGQVDLKFPHGVTRFPVEELVLDTSGDYKSSLPLAQKSTQPVSAGLPSKERVASLYLTSKKYRR